MLKTGFDGLFGVSIKRTLEDRSCFCRCRCRAMREERERISQLRWVALDPVSFDGTILGQGGGGLFLRVGAGSSSSLFFGLCCREKCNFGCDEAWRCPVL